MIIFSNMFAQLAQVNTLKTERVHNLIQSAKARAGY